MNDLERAEHQNYIIDIILNKVVKWNFDYKGQRYTGQHKGYKYSVSWVVPDAPIVFIGVESLMGAGSLSFTAKNANITKLIEEKWEIQEAERVQDRLQKEDALLKKLADAIKKAESVAEVKPEQRLPH